VTDETTARQADRDEDVLTDEERRALDGVLDAHDARGDSTADLWAFAFDGPLRAQEALLAALRMVGRGQLKLEDAAIVAKVGGRVRISQTKDVSTGQAAVSGTWLGTLAGLFVGQPLIGAAIGAAVGGLFGKLRDIGIDDDQMRRMGEGLQDGEAALFLLVEECHQVRALHEVSRFVARLLATTASDELAEQVRGRLATDPWGA
jgi:uncharacterized membrane protein